MARTLQTGRNSEGFTIAELLVVLVIIALLATIAMPNVTGAIRRAEEAALQENLLVMRRALDDYYADKGAYPPTLEDLVTQKYLRAIPHDPVTDDTDWSIVSTGEGGIEDIKSNSREIGSNDEQYSDW